MNNPTNFQKIVEFHKQFGLVHTEHPQVDVFDKDKKLVDFRLSLIDEEVRELKEGVENKDWVEVVDALGDILYVVYGMGASIGVNMDEAYRLIHDSNMSKLCKSEDEAHKTVQWYEEKYKSGEQPYDSPAYRKSDDGQYWVVYNKSTSKILKSINYNPVDLTPLLYTKAECEE